MIKTFNEKKLDPSDDVNYKTALLTLHAKLFLAGEGNYISKLFETFDAKATQIMFQNIDILISFFKSNDANYYYFNKFMADFGTQRLETIVIPERISILKPPSLSEQEKNFPNPKRDKFREILIKRSLVYYFMLNAIPITENQKILSASEKSSIEHVSLIKFNELFIHFDKAPKKPIEDRLEPLVAHLKGQITSLSYEKSENAIKLLTTYKKILALCPNEFVNEILAEEVVLNEFNTKFLEAAKIGDFKVCQELIESKKINIDYTDNLNHSALYYAWKNKHDNIFQFLLKQPKINLDIPEFETGNTLLANVIKATDYHSMNLLLENKADPNLKNKANESSLYLAYKTNPLFFNRILEHPNLQIDALVATPPKTILMAAAENKDTDSVKILLEKKADPRIKNSDGTTAFSIALKFDKQIAAEILENQLNRFGIQDISIFSAYDCSSRPVLHTLLENKADPNSIDNDGRSLLILAAQADDPWLLKELLSYDADISKQCGNNSAFCQAILSENINGVNLLLQRGKEKNIDLANTLVDGRTPLYHAVNISSNSNIINRVAIINSLITSGAKVDVFSSDGWTAFHRAIYSDNLDILNAIFDAKPDIAKADGNGLTPLMIAIKYNKNVSFNELLKRGCPITPAVIEFAKTKNNEVSREVIELASKSAASAPKIGFFEKEKDKPDDKTTNTQQSQPKH